MCVPPLEMVGSAELYKTPKSYLEEVNKEYCHRRDVLYDAIMEIPGVVCEKPTGAFYMQVKLPVENAEDFVIFMLNEFSHNGGTTMATPAENFYATPGLGRDEETDSIHKEKIHAAFRKAAGIPDPRDSGADRGIN